MSYLYHSLVPYIIERYGRHPIRLQTKSTDGCIQCNICNRRCEIGLGGFGLCYAVYNFDGVLVSTTYERVLARSACETEALNIFHYKPKMTFLIFGTIYCNFGCDFCVNTFYSRPNLLTFATGLHWTASALIDMTKESGAKGINFGLNEPTMWLDFVIDTATLAKKNGLYVVINSNGYMTEKAIKLLAPVIDAVCISVKGMGDPKVYNDLISKGPASAEHVLNTIKSFHDKGVYVEVTGLPLHNQPSIYARNLSEWLVANVDRQIPLYLQPIQPLHLENRCEQDFVSLNELSEIISICRESGLIYVYSAYNSEQLSTYCPKCRELLVKRRTRSSAISIFLGRPNSPSALDVEFVGLNVVNSKGFCRNCDTEIYGVWS
jgi:pyruvate formate lyase activating enzyme